MTLKITDDDSASGIDVYRISILDFNDKAFHPFIATSRWDSVEIDLNDSVAGGILHQLITRSKIIPIFDDNNITPKVLNLLCEVVPDERPKLRVASMKGKEELKSVITQLREKYDWSLYK